MIIGSKNGSCKWVLNQFLYLYLNNILLYEHNFKADIYMKKANQKENVWQGVSFVQKEEVGTYRHLLCILRLSDKRFW